jgi:hypothetical protein
MKVRPAPEWPADERPESRDVLTQWAMDNHARALRDATPEGHYGHRGDFSDCPYPTCVSSRNTASLSGEISAPAEERETPVQAEFLHPAHQVWFRAGLLACREYMARFVEAESPSIAMSIRANWWPSLGQDFGPPRKLDFAELTEGEFGTPGFRVKTAAEVSATQEALPIALGFLQQPEAALPAEDRAVTAPQEQESMKQWNSDSSSRKG